LSAEETEKQELESKSEEGVAAGIVLVLVLECVAADECMDTQRLERSRFIIRQLYRLLAGGSRELPRATFGQALLFFGVSI
jgi:hypothetical protein